MSSSFGPKKTFKQKLSSAKGSAVRAFKKAVAITAAAGALIGAPGYYFYGTEKEQEVKVQKIDRKFLGWNEEKYVYEYGDYTIVTDKGRFRNEDTHTRLKYNSEAMNDMFTPGKVYSVRSYGHLPFGLIGRPNIIDAREITPEELEARAQQEAERKKQQAQERPPVPSAAEKTAAADTPAQDGEKPKQALSGQTTRVIITAEGYDVHMTAPVEAVDKIRIEKVSETQPIRIIQPPRP